MMAMHALKHLIVPTCRPEFLQEIVALYFQDAASKMDKLDQCWVRQPVNFHEVDQIAHQLKGASASFGACQVAAICVQVSWTPTTARQLLVVSCCCWMRKRASWSLALAHVLIVTLH